MNDTPQETKRVLIFCDYYLPGFRAGGPIISISKIVKMLSPNYEVFIITRNKDYASNAPYEGIKPNVWHKTEDVSIFYCENSLTFKEINMVFKSIDPDLVYFNSLLSRQYSIKPLLVTILNRKIRAKKLICPRGELNPGAIFYKTYRKKLFLLISKLFHLYDGVEFHATSQYESLRIKKYLKNNSKITIASNLPREPDRDNNFHNETRNFKLKRFAYVGRIHPIKNLHLLLESLKNIKGQLQFDIVGPIDDQSYWRRCSSLIDSLPINIKCKFHGPMQNKEVLRLVSKSHLLCLLSSGENFGQVIFESMSVSVPVLISRKTPWKDLQDKKAGWDLDLSNKVHLETTLQEVVNLSFQDWKVYSKGAKQLAMRFYGKSLQENKEMFKGILNDS